MISPPQDNRPLTYIEIGPPVYRVYHMAYTIALAVSICGLSLSITVRSRAESNPRNWVTKHLYRFGIGRRLRDVKYQSD